MSLFVGAFPLLFTDDIFIVPEPQNIVSFTKINGFSIEGNPEATILIVYVAEKNIGLLILNISYV